MHKVYHKWLYKVDVLKVHHSPFVSVLWMAPDPETMQAPAVRRTEPLAACESLLAKWSVDLTGGGEWGQPKCGYRIQPERRV